jgi:hypothetical protein
MYNVTALKSAQKFEVGGKKGGFFVLFDTLG